VRILHIIIIMLVCLTVQASAQTAADVTITLHRSGFDQYRASVEDFKPSQFVVSPEEMKLALEITQIVRDDLNFHIAFENIPMDSSLLIVLEMTEMSRLAWKHLGAEYLVTGNFEFTDDEISVQYMIWDLNRMMEVKSDGFRTDRRNYRALAHSISDDVIWRVAGYDPMFNTKMTYVSAKSGNKEIYICDYDGSNAYPLTANGSINISPVWGAQGKSVYYTSYKDGTPDLFRVDLLGGKHTKVASFQGINSAAAISPDNDEICLTLSKDGNAELYLLDISGKIKRRLTRTRGIESSPSFGPGAHSIAFSSDRTGTPQVYLMDREGLNVRRVTYEGRYNDSPALSPDGSKVAFVTRTSRGNFDICVVDVDGEHFRVITKTGSNENPHWAPDSYHLVYSSRRGDVSDLYISDFLGLNKRRITGDTKSSNPYWGPASR